MRLMNKKFLVILAPGTFLFGLSLLKQYILLKPTKPGRDDMSFSALIKKMPQPKM